MLLRRVKNSTIVRRGFSLVELLVVISIIAILTAVVVFSIKGVSNKSTKAACQSDVATVQAASDAYYASNNAYAATIAALVTANLIRSAPSSASYTLSLSTTDGSVTSSPACSTL